MRDSSFLVFSSGSELGSLFELDSSSAGLALACLQEAACGRSSCLRVACPQWSSWPQLQTGDRDGRGCLKDACPQWGSWPQLRTGDRDGRGCLSDACPQWSSWPQLQTGNRDGRGCLRDACPQWSPWPQLQTTTHRSLVAALMDLRPSVMTPFWQCMGGSSASGSRHDGVYSWARISAHALSICDRLRR